MALLRYVRKCVPKVAFRKLRSESCVPKKGCGGQGNGPHRAVCRIRPGAPAPGSRARDSGERTGGQGSVHKTRHIPSPSCRSPEARTTCAPQSRMAPADRHPADLCPVHKRLCKRSPEKPCLAARSEGRAGRGTGAAPCVHRDGHNMPFLNPGLRQPSP